MSEAAIRIRRYEPGEAEAIQAVHERAIRASPLPFIEDARDPDLENVAGFYLDGGGEFLVGKTDGRVVAIGGFRPRDERTVEIRRMRVDPEVQRNGFGTRILEALEDRARRRGYTGSELSTHERLAAARRLYETNGYEEIRREPIPQTDDELIHYAKDLD